MNFSLKTSDILRSSANSVVLLRYKNSIKDAAIKKIDKKLNGFLFDRINALEFNGEFGKKVSIDCFGNYKFNDLSIVGLGSKRDFNSVSAYRVGNIIGSSLKNFSESIAIDFSNLRKEHLDLVIEGIIIGCYEYNRFKTKKQNKSKIGKIDFHSKIVKSSYFKSKVNRAKSVSSSISISRDLVNDPPNKLTPVILADHAMEISNNSDSLECRVYDENELAEMGMGGLTAVSLGSENPPRFIHLSYTPKKMTKKQIALVGKGITFDSGGLCIKPADGMRTMKMDMAGAAVVLGVMKAVGELKPNVAVHGLVPTTENMTGGLAYKPDDVVKVFSGKTVEIINTDAEGRMALSDALGFAVKNNMSEIVDLATLTGACIVGLGMYTAGVFGNNQKLTKSILDSAEKTGEKMWQLPLDEELKSELKSNVADLKHVGSRWGGAITAALFLENFVSDTPWVHIDIAGPSFMEKANDWYPYGATGFGVKTLVDYLMRSA